MANVLDRENNVTVLSKGFIGSSQTMTQEYAPHVDVQYGPFTSFTNALLSFKNLFNKLSNIPVGLLFGIKETDGSVGEYRVDKKFLTAFDEYPLNDNFKEELFDGGYIQEYCIRKSMIFQGTQAQYDSLSNEAKRGYYLAFIEED